MANDLKGGVLIRVEGWENFLKKISGGTPIRDPRVMCWYVKAFQQLSLFVIQTS